jgi:hypothetical protein
MQAMYRYTDTHARARFRNAVLAFSDDPSKSNFARYLAASKLLDDALESASRPSPAKRRVASQT